jgi:RNA polymerase sigma-70 factor (ECF subfamily)
MADMGIPMNAVETTGAVRSRPVGSAERARAREFEALFRAHSRAILGYAVRRCDPAEDAADVLAEVMLTAWRRWADVPVGGEARLWLYGVARRVLANRSRAERRRSRLVGRLRAEVAERVREHSEPDDRDSEVRSALKTLSPTDREVLLLSAWEDLEPTEIAAVLDITPVTARSRLHRARARLGTALSDGDAIPSEPPKRGERP